MKEYRAAREMYREVKELTVKVDAGDKANKSLEVRFLAQALAAQLFAGPCADKIDKHIPFRFSAFSNAIKFAPFATADSIPFCVLNRPS